MANVLGAPETAAMGMDERVHHLFGRIPDVKVHLYGKVPAGPQDRATSTSSATRRSSTRQSVAARERATRAATGCRTASGPTDGTGMTEQAAAAVGLIMGSDSDWPVMAAADALAEFESPTRSG